MKLFATIAAGALALILAAVGLYGTMAYRVARRRAEIGIRMALGAASARVLRLVLGEVLVTAGIGVAIGLVAAFALARLAATLLYGVGAHDPWTLAAGALVLLGVATLSGFLPARRASRIDPMQALREE